MSFRRNYRALPNNPDGYPINADREWVSIIVPEATTNLFTNPSWETNTTGWTLTGTATYARTATYQCKGSYCASITVTSANTAARIVGHAVVSGTLYTMSFHVRRAGRAPIKPSEIAAYVNGAAIAFDALEYIADGWWRAIKTFQATATTAPGIQFTASRASDVLYVDAAQLEAKGYPTTYCDGDQLGLLPIGLEPTPYAWTGASHGSTSTRSAATRAGGREMRLDRYGFTLLSMIGLGASKRVNIATPLGLIDGSFYQTTIREARTFSLAGSFEASDPYALSKNQAALRAAIQHDSTGYAQPLVLTAQRFDGTTALSAKGQIVASYADGLDGNVTQLFSQRASISFEQYQSGIASSAARSLVATVPVSTIFNYVASFTDGTWSTMAGGANGPIYCSIIASDGNLYIGGTFTSVGGVSANNIAMWDGLAWSALGSGTSGTVYCLCSSPANGLWLGGDFVTAGGVTVNNIALYSSGTWAAAGSGAVGTNGIVYGIAEAYGGGLSGCILLVGAFTTAGGLARLSCAQYSLYYGFIAGTASFNGTCYCIAPSKTMGQFYIGGAFTTVNGLSNNRIVKYAIDINNLNAVTISSLGTGFNNTCYAIAIGAASILYAGGSFTSLVAMWNGSTWSSVGNAFASGTLVRALAYDADRRVLYAGGDFTVSAAYVYATGGQKTPLAMWDGNTWVPAPLYPTYGTSPTIYTITALRYLFIGFASSFLWYPNVAIPVVNTGNVVSPAEISITANGQIVVVGIVNYTSNKAIYFSTPIVFIDNTQGVMIIRYISGVLRVTNTLYGAMDGIISEISDPTALLIYPGLNIISVLTAFNPNYEQTTVLYIPNFDDLDGLTGR